MGKKEVEGLVARSDRTREFLIRHFYPAHVKLGQDFLIEFRFMNSAGATLSHFCRFDEISEIIEGPLLMNEEEGWHVHFGINPRPLSRDKKEGDISEFLCFWVDLDVGEDKPHKTLKEAEARVATFPLPPTRIIYSGGGLHVYWYLLEPITIESSDQREKLKTILRGLIHRLAGDPSGSSLERVMRLPGTINHKNGNMCTVKPDTFDTPRQYTIVDFEPLAESDRQPTPARAVDIQYPGVNIARSFAETTEEAAREALCQLEVSERIRELIRRGSTEGFNSRSERDFSIIIGLLRKPYDFDTIRALFFNKFYGCSDRIRERGERCLAGEVRRALTKREQGEYHEGIEYPAQAEPTPKPQNDTIQAGEAEPDLVGDATSTSRLDAVASGSRPVLIPLDAVVATPVRWLWPNRIPSGKITLIVGDPGQGKSFLSLYLAAHVTTGEPWPDCEVRMRPGSVIILTAEDGIADTVKPRSVEMGADLTKIKVLDGVVRPDNRQDLFNLQKDVESLEVAFRETGEVRLIIIDPLTAYLGGTDSHKNAEVRGVLAPLAALAERHDVAVLGITHLNKNAALEAIHRAMGSIAFVATARAVWAVTRDYEDESKGRRLFIPVKTNLSINPTALAFRIVGSKVIFEHDPVEVDTETAFSNERTGAVSALNEAVQFLQEALQDGPIEANTIFKLAREMQISRITVNRAKKKLEIKPIKEGRAQSCRWFWRLPEKKA